MTCTGGTPTFIGSYVPTINITIALNTQLTSRILDATNNITEALLLVNDPGSTNSPLTPTLCPAVPGNNYACATSVVGTGFGGGQNVSPYQYANANIYQGVLVALNQVTFFNVPIDPPGYPFFIAGNFVNPALKLRITNIRGNASALAFPIGSTPSPLVATLSTSAGIPITQPFNGNYAGNTSANLNSGLVGKIVSADAQISQCSVSGLQPAFTVSVTEGFTASLVPQFPATISDASIPGNTGIATSGFLIPGLPLNASSPGVADFGTRFKLTFGNTPAGVTLYVPTAINSGIFPPDSPSIPTLTARLTASENGPFSPVAATNGQLAAVTNNEAIYEVVSELPVSLNTIETLMIPVSLSYSGAPGSSPTTGSGTVQVDFAPSSNTVTASTGPIPRFIVTSPNITTYTITPCPIPTFTSYSGTPQSVAINTAFSSPLQALLKDSNGNPLGSSSVTFSLPTNGSGAVFAGGGNVATVSTNAQGIATSPQLTANGVAGTFTATAATGSNSSSLTSFTLTNLQGTSVLTFTPISTHYVGDVPFTLTATSSASPAPIVFTVMSGPATVSGMVVTVAGTGTVTIQASQPPTASYPAASATQSFSVAPGPSPDIRCIANAATPNQTKGDEGVTELVGDLVVSCTGGIPTPLNTPVPLVNITVTLNSQFTSRLVNGANVSEALLLINDPAPASQILCPADPTQSFSCSVRALGTGSGGGKGVSPAQYTGANIYQGVLTDINQVTFFDVPVDAPGPDVTVIGQTISPTLTFRITNVRVNAAALGYPTGFTTTPITESVSASSPLVSIANPQQIVGANFQSLVNRQVSGAAQFSQCATQALQPAFTASITEGFASVLATRFATPIALESIPGNFQGTTSGFLINRLPLTTSSPGVADFATRIKFRFGNTPSGVTLYVPTTLSYINIVAGVPTLTATLTSTEAGAFSAVPASPGTNGTLAAVTNGSAIYEVTSEHPISVNTVETLSLPVYLSYSSSPTAGVGTVNISLAPTVAPPVSGGSTGPVPAFVDDSTPLNTYAITSCGSNSFTGYSGTPQSATINSAFSSPLQAILKDVSGNPIANSPITFTLPAAGPGATFTGGSSTATVSTNSQGIATSPQVTANGTVGTFTATATNGSIGASFSLTNLPNLTTRLTFAPISSHLVGDAPFALSATSTSPSPIVFSVLSGPANISGALVTVTGVGSVTVQASQAASNGYPAATATQIFIVSTPPNYSQTINFPAIPDHNATDQPFTLNASASSGLPVQFIVVAGPASIKGNLVTLTGAGFVSIEADQPGNGVYPAAPSVTNSFHSFGAGPMVTSLMNGGHNSTTLAPDSYAEILGANLGTQTVSLSTPPFPAQIAGLTLVLTDSAGQQTPLLLYYVSPTQIDLYLPPSIALGAATLVITNGAARTTSVNVTIARVSPALLSAGQSTLVNGRWYFTLYGTGFRNAKNISVTVGGQPAQVLFVGPQSQFPGLDQINVSVAAAGLPASPGAVLMVDGAGSNVLPVAVQ